MLGATFGKTSRSTILRPFAPRDFAARTKSRSVTASVFARVTRAAFLSSMHTVALVSAALLLGVAVLNLLMLRHLAPLGQTEHG